MKQAFLFMFVTMLAFSLAFRGVQTRAIEPGVSYCFIPGDEKVKPDFELKHTSLKVNWYDTIDEVQQATDTKNIEGMSEWYVAVDPETGEEFSWCELWVPRPVSVNGDPNMDTLGHEVLHCLMGSFHED